MKQEKKQPLLRCGTLLAAIGAAFLQFGVCGTKAETEQTDLSISAEEGNQTELNISAEEGNQTELSISAEEGNQTELGISAGQESQTELSTSCEQETDTDLSMAGVQMSRLQLNDLSMYAESLQEDLDEMQDLYTESVQWEDAGTPLEESDYSWIFEARELLVNYFQKTYQIDLLEKMKEIEIWTSDAIPETIGGFSDGTGKIFLNQEDLEQYKEDDARMRHTVLHEMIHAVGVDFYNDTNGLRSNAFYEGLTEALTKAVLEDAGEAYEDTSTYGDLAVYSGKVIEADPQLVVDLVSGAEDNIAARIDRKLGVGIGKELLDAQSLLAFSYWDDSSVVYENCERIADAYAGA